jgi:molybdopterin-guanine dinucleotide biosynthesis protein A
MSLDEFAHQTVESPQTAYQNALADALEKIFATGAHDLPAVIGALNTAQVKAPDGAAWTEDSFRSVMADFGA